MRDLQILSADDMQGRQPDTPGGAKARQYILGRFNELHLRTFKDSYLQSFEFSYPRETAVHKGVNVIGFIKGDVTPERYLVITAHYDHLGIRNGQVYNGADDNASGTVALFSLIEYFNKHHPQNSMIFAALDAEERSGAGGRKLVTDPPVAKSAMVMNVNLDMLARDQNNILYAVGTYHYPFLTEYLNDVASHSPVKLLLGHDKPNQPGVEDWTTESDHYSFHREKIPFIYFGVEDNEQHHKPTDDFGNITPLFFVGAVETVILAVKQFDEHLAEIEKHKAHTPGA